MFSGLFNSRLKAAEKALSEGRWDEAFRLAVQPDLRKNKRGGAVLASLAEKFLERARKAYREDRFAEALMDLDRAEAGGILQEQIAELRQYVQTVATETARHEDSRRDRIQAAVKRIEDGSLDAGRQILAKAVDDPVAREVHRKVVERAAEVATIIEQASRLLGGGQLAQAADRVRKGKSIDAHHPELARIETTLCERILGEARTALGEGKLARAADELNCLGDLGAKLPTRKELTDLLSIAREAGSHLTAHDYSEARRAMMTLAARLGETPWIKITLEHLRVLTENYATVSAGPLGDRMDRQHGRGLPPARIDDRTTRPSSLDDTVGLPSIRRGGECALPDRVLLLVDGGGSYLILRGNAASLGRVAAEHPADIPVYSDVAERHANIQRVDDDYFVFGTKEIEVGGRPVQHQLLRDGDRVVLGKKAKFNFRVPSRKSPSAVLELSDTTKMPNDVRRVVLFHQSATLGQGSTAHILCRHAALPLVLFERGGGLWIRQQNDGHADGAAKAVRLGESIEIGGVSLTLQAWKTGGTMGSA
jgi:hypothetical protein